MAMPSSWMLSGTSGVKVLHEIKNINPPQDVLLWKTDALSEKNALLF
jgi:hypothetical protein